MYGKKKKEWLIPPKLLTKDLFKLFEKMAIKIHDTMVEIKRLYERQKTWSGI
jgi:hypothetical protein